MQKSRSEMHGWKRSSSSFLRVQPGLALHRANLLVLLTSSAAHKQRCVGKERSGGAMVETCATVPARLAKS
jgi:hypothetical protein